jgi:hypothetical protein
LPTSKARLGDGRYDLLEIETRYLKDPRVYDGTGLPPPPDLKFFDRLRIPPSSDNSK